MCSMTKQEVFNTVRTHLLRQGKKAVKDGSCVYRTPDGLSCAVGCLIPDKHYNSSIEGAGVGGCVVADLLKKIGIIPDSEKFIDYNSVFYSESEKEYTINPGTYLRLLRDLQRVHDGVAVKEWEEKLANVAEYHGLAVE